ncbi:hypothetical protein VC87395_002504 [Vibrio paracholerae 87395]|nr:hypothetical protein VCHE09_1342 [Vibrio paracholerae HE-09]EMP91457.1 hypothetical protein VC87395_002504 [Vibrio paracholerae 87395]
MPNQRNNAVSFWLSHKDQRLASSKAFLLSNITIDAERA